MTQQAQAVPFRQACKAVRLTLPSVSLTAFGQTAPRVELQPVGYLHKVWIRLNGTIVTGAGSPTGAIQSYPELPWGLLSKIRLYVTPGVDIINVSGNGLKDLLTLSRFGQLFEGDDASQAANYTTQNLGNQADNFKMPIAAGATPAGATTYTFNCCWELPISTDDSLLWGLVPLQNDLARANLEVTLCPQGNVGNIGVVTLTPSFTVQVVQETFVLPTDIQVQPPFLGLVHKIIETPVSVANTGDNFYKPLINPIYLRHYVAFENQAGSSGAAWTRLGVGAGNTALTNVAYRFAQQTYLLNEPYQVHVARSKVYLGNTLMDGAVFIDATNGMGIPGIVDPRDMINTSQQTSVQLIGTIASGTSITNAQMRAVDEYLTPA